MAFYAFYPPSAAGSIVPAPGSTFTVVQPTAANLNANVSGTVTVQQTTAANLNATVVQPTAANLNATVAQSGTWNINNVSGTISLPTGAATSANQTNVQSSPGSSAGTAITVQGSASGVPIPVSGSITASNPSVSTTGATVPASATYVGFLDSTGKLNSAKLNASQSLLVDGTGGSFPVSGSVTVSQATASSLNATVVGSGGVALATSANQTNVQAAAGSTTSTALTVQGNASGTPIPVSGSFSLSTGFVSTSNSSTTPLGISGVFTGTGEDITNYGSVQINIYTDQAGTAAAQFSANGTNWDQSESYTIAAATALDVNISPRAKWFRIVYTNGGVAQTVLRLQTVYKTGSSAGDVEQVVYAPGDNDYAMITKGVIYGKTTGGGGGYVAVKVNPSGALTVDASNSTGLVLAAGSAVIGTVTAQQSTAANLNATVVQSTAANLNATVVQGTATNLKAQAEAYQGGTAVGSANPLQVTLANTGANATAVKVDGTGGSFPVSGSVTVSQATASSLNATVVQSTASNLNATVVGTAGAALATSANQTNVQGSATGGTAGTSSMLAGGIYNSSAPTLTTGQQAALQFDVNGNLKVTPSTTPKAPVNLNASGSAAAATVSTVTTLTAPSNAVGFILMNLDVSTANIRYAIGRTAATNLGQQLQPGRDTGFVPCGANVSIIAESGTQTYDIQWISQ